MGLKIGFVVRDDGTGWPTLHPAGALDVELMAKLQIGPVYVTEFSMMRNYKFHQRYFAMLGVILENMDDKIRSDKGITTIETLLLQVKLELGHCDYLWLDKYQQFCLTPKSISFAAMDEFEFKTFYKNTLDLCIEHYLARGPSNPVSWMEFVEDAVNKLVGFML